MAKEEIKKLVADFKKLNGADQCKMIMQVVAELRNQRQEKQIYCKENKKINYGISTR